MSKFGSRLAAAGLAVLGLSAAHPADAYLISRVGGGDCAQIGVWNQKARTCTLSRDLVNAPPGPGGEASDIITVRDNGITIDGAGHRLNGRNSLGEGGVGIRLIGTSGVVVKNLVLDDFSFGIHISGIDPYSSAFLGSTGNKLTGSTFANNDAGVGLYYADAAEISGSTFTGNATGITLSNCDGATIARNTLSGNGCGLWSSEFSNSAISENVSENNEVGFLIGQNGLSSGIAFFGNTVRDNLQLPGPATVYHNNFFGSFDESGLPNRYVVFEAGGNGTYDLALPTGGNYWNYFDSGAEGCADADSNRICDQPYQEWYRYFSTLSGYVTVTLPVVDDLPWTTPDGWKTAVGGSEGSGSTCSDGQDNDADGLTDCADPGCAKNRACR